MSDLSAIIRATRASACAINRMARLAREIRATDDEHIRAKLFRQYDRALFRYHAAQQTLASNPLPGDPQ